MCELSPRQVYENDVFEQEQREISEAIERELWLSRTGEGDWCADWPSGCSIGRLPSHGLLRICVVKEPHLYGGGRPAYHLKFLRGAGRWVRDIDGQIFCRHWHRLKNCEPKGERVFLYGFLDEPLYPPFDFDEVSASLPPECEITNPRCLGEGRDSFCGFEGHCLLRPNAHQEGRDGMGERFAWLLARPHPNIGDSIAVSRDGFRYRWKKEYHHHEAIQCHGELK